MCAVADGFVADGFDTNILSPSAVMVTTHPLITSFSSSQTESMSCNLDMFERFLASLDKPGDDPTQHITMLNDCPNWLELGECAVEDINEKMEDRSLKINNKGTAIGGDAINTDDKGCTSEESFDELDDFLMIDDDRLGRAQEGNGEMDMSEILHSDCSNNNTDQGEYFDSDDDFVMVDCRRYFNYASEKEFPPLRHNETKQNDAEVVSPKRRDKQNSRNVKRNKWRSAQYLNSFSYNKLLAKRASLDEYDDEVKTCLTCVSCTCLYRCSQHRRLSDFNSIFSSLDILDAICNSKISKMLDFEGNISRRDSKNTIRRTSDLRLCKVRTTIRVKEDYCLFGGKSRFRRGTVCVAKYANSALQIDVRYIHKQISMKNIDKRWDLLMDAQYPDGYNRKKVATAHIAVVPGKNAKCCQRHVLNQVNADNDLPQDLINDFIDLQERDLTPEDYDLLLHLDERIARKTIELSFLKDLKTEKCSEKDCDDLCTICFENFVVGHMKKFLPCDHFFHDNCIDNWLTFSSANCPIDNLPIIST